MKTNEARYHPRPALTGFARLLAVGAAAMTAAPGYGIAAGGVSWVEFCSGHGVERRAIPLGPVSPGGKEEGLACHAACTLPRKRLPWI